MHTPSGQNPDEGTDSPKNEIEKISTNVTTDTNNEPDKTTSAVIKRLSIRCPVKSDTLDGSETAQYEPKMNTSQCKLVNYRTILGSNIRSLELKGFPKLESDTKTQATAELTRRRGMSARTSPPLNSPSRMQSPTSVQCATRTEEIQSDVSAHPFVTSGPDFEGEQTFRFDKAVKDMQIPSRPNFMKSDESLPLRIGDGVVSDDYVLPYKEWKVKDESSSTTKAKGRIIESSPTLEELPKLKPPENKIAILLKNIKKTPKKEEETIAVSLKDTDSSYENLTKPVIRFDSGPYETTLTQNHRQRSSGYHSTLERFTVLDKDDREYEEEFTALVLERTFPNQQNDNQQQQYEYCPMMTCQPEHDIYQQQGYSRGYSRGYSQEENCFYQYPALTETHTYERDSLPYQNPTYLTDYSRYENATGYVMPTEAYNYPDDYNRQSVVYARDRQSVVYAPPPANQAAGSTLTYQRPAQEVHDEYLEHDYTPYAITLNPIPSSAGEADADVPQTVNFQDVGLRHREATENRETPGDAPVAIVDKVSVLSSIGKLVSGNRQSVVLKSYVSPTELTPKKKKRVKRDTGDKRLNSIYAIRYYPTPSELNLGLSSDDDHISTRAYLCLSLLSCLCCPLLAFLALWFTVQLADARKTGNKIAMSERGKLVRLFVISAIALGIVTYSIIIATTVFANIPVPMANNTVSQ